MSQTATIRIIIAGMKILHVETGRHLYGGPQQVLYLIAALAERAYDNTLVCPPGSGIDNAARAAGIRVQNLFCAGDLDLPFAYRLAQYLKQEQPDLVHCHSRRGADMLGGIAASFADIPAVVSRRVDNTEMRIVAALRYRPFRKVIAISETIAEVLRERGVDEKRLVVIRSAVDTEAFGETPDSAAFRKEFDIADDAFVVAAAGQLIPRKGHRYLLEAIAGLREQHPSLRLLVFGEGYLNNQLQSQAATLGVEEIVTFAGFRHDLDDWMGCFDLFVHPALAEGLGVAALKAAAAGVPVVGFAAGGLIEAVEDGTTGLLVTPGDASELSEAISTLIKDESLRRQLGAAGRARMHREFSIATMVDKHVQLYKLVLDEPR